MKKKGFMFELSTGSVFFVSEEKGKQFAEALNSKNLSPTTFYGLTDVKGTIHNFQIQYLVQFFEEII